MEKEEKKLTRSFLLPHYVPYFKELDMNQRLVLVALLEREDNFKGQEGRNINGKPFYCTQEWLASQLSISLSTIKRSLKKLQGENYINRSRRKAGDATTYAINWETIENLNDNFKFGVEKPQQILSSTEIIETEHKSAAETHSVTETPAQCPEALPHKMSDVSEEFWSMANPVIAHKNLRDEEERKAICVELMEKTQHRYEYVERALLLVLQYMKEEVVVAEQPATTIDTEAYDDLVF